MSKKKPEDARLDHTARLAAREGNEVSTLIGDLFLLSSGANPELSEPGVWPAGVFIAFAVPPQAR